MKKALIGGTATALIAGFALGAYLYRKDKSLKLDFLAQEQAATFVRPHSPTLGSPDAKVYLVEFLDPACEACAAFADFVKQGVEHHSGKLQLVLRYAPFHEGATDVVRILEAARRQNKYWETLDLLLSRQADWTHHHQVQLDRVWVILEKSGLDIAQIKKDMMDPTITRLIEQDLDDAKTLNVRRTPGFFVNGKPLEDFGYAQLKDLIEAEIKKQYPD